MAYVTPNARVIAAIIVGQSNALDIAAGEVLRSVRGVAASHRLTGNYSSKLSIIKAPGQSGTGRLVQDRLVVADDEAVLPIEFGYIRRLGNRRVQYVPGLHIMRKGLDRVR